MNANLLPIIAFWRKLDLDPVRNHPGHQRRQNQLIRLRKEHGDNCCYCGGVMVFRKRKQTSPVRPDDATIEHMIPKRLGGPNALWNLRLAHSGCNHWADKEIIKVEQYLDGE